MAVAGHLWRRFRGRMVRLRCEVTHVPVTNTPATIGTQVEVRYLGVSTPYLFQCSVVVENDSTTDLENITLNLAYKDGTIFISGGGAVDASNQTLPLLAAFVEAYSRSSALSDEERPTSPEWQYTSTHRDFLIPVLNRGARARFLFTVHGVSAGLPQLTASCDHVGVRLIMQAPRQLFLGVPTNSAALWGLAAGALLLWAATDMLTASWRLTWTFFLAGATAQLVGALLIRASRLLVRALS